MHTQYLLQVLYVHTCVQSDVLSLFFTISHLKQPQQFAIVRAPPLVRPAVVGEGVGLIIPAFLVMLLKKF